MLPLTRVAFLVDNYRYGHRCFWGDLGGNHDVVDEVQDVLEAMAFKCNVQKNGRSADLRALPHRIGASLAHTHGGLALVYWSGHGMMYNGQLYLISPDQGEKEAPRRLAAAIALLALASFAFAACLDLARRQDGVLGAAVLLLIYGPLCWIFGKTAQALKVCDVGWKLSSWHPLSNACCFNGLERQLAAIHDSHSARFAVIILLLECCRDLKGLSWWQRCLLCLLVHEEPLMPAMSIKNSRPNFFQIYACEEGRTAEGDPASGGYLTSAVLKSLQQLSTKACTLDELLTNIDQNLRACCSLGRQKFCMYSTAYRLAKDILVWDEALGQSVVPAPTLLATVGKKRLMTMKPMEQRVFHQHRQGKVIRPQEMLLQTDDLKAMILLRDLAGGPSRKRRFLQSAKFVKAIKRERLRPRNLEMLMFELNAMQAKFLCDQSLALLGKAITTSFSIPTQSVERKLRRVDDLLRKVVSLMDLHLSDAYMRGKVEEVIAGSIAARTLQDLHTFGRTWSFCPSLRAQAVECAGHYRAALQAYAEAALAADSARLAVIWRIASLFAAMFARDLPDLASQLAHLEHAVANCSLYHPNYRNQWVIRPVLAVAKLGVRFLQPGVAFLQCLSRISR